MAVHDILSTFLVFLANYKLWIITISCVMVALVFLDIARAYFGGSPLARHITTDNSQASAIIVPLSRGAQWFAFIVLALFFSLASFLYTPEDVTAYRTSAEDFDYAMAGVSLEAPLMPTAVDRGQVLAEAIATIKYDAHTTFDSALVSIGLAQFDSAVLLLDLALAQGTDDPVLQSDWLYFRGLANQFDGNDTVALLDFDKALALNPAHAEAWLNRALVLAELCRVEEARESYIQAIAHATETYTYDYFIGMTYLKLHEYMTALKHFNAAVAASPGYMEAWYGRGMVFSIMGSRIEALVCINRALDINGTSALAWSEKAKVQASLGDSTGALPSVDSAIVHGRNSAMTWVTCATTLLELNHVEAALSYLDSALAFGRSNPLAWYYRGVALTRMGTDLDKALHSLEAALVYMEDFPEARIQRAIVFYRLGNIEEFTADLGRAFKLECEANPALAWIHRGEAFSQVGEPDSARACFQQAFRVSGNRPDLGFLIAQGLADAGDLGNALIATNQALTWLPDWNEANTFKAQLDRLLKQQDG